MKDKWQNKSGCIIHKVFCVVYVFEGRINPSLFKFVIMKLIYSILMFAFFLALGSCVSNKEEDLPKPLNNCDTLAMSYAGDIASIFQKNRCLDCHSTQTATAGIILDTYQDVVNNADKIYPAISWPAGTPPGKQMPVGGPKVSQCEIDQFAAWMNQGKKP